MKIKNIFFPAEQEILSALSITKKNQKPSLLFLHGGGKSEKYKTLPLAKQLFQKGISSFSFDHSGSGESTGKMKDSSLKKRWKEAKTAMDFLDENAPLTVCGNSMGGYVATKLLETKKVRTLILFCPAAYNKNAFPAPFNTKFTEIIRKEESWKQSDIFPLLKNFTGNFLLVIGEDDEVIPEGAIELFDAHTQQAAKKEIIRIPNVGHQIHIWLQEHPEEMEEIAEKMVKYME